MASGIELAHLPSGMFSSIINGQEILEEEYNEDFEPTDEEIKEYCDVLGLDPVKESDLLYIAKEAIKAPLPPEWKPCKNGSEDIYYFNFQTGESSWDHPCDKYYVELLERERTKKRNKGTASKTKKNTQHQHTPSIKPLMAGTAKLQGPAELPALSRKGINPLQNLPPLRSGVPQLGPLRLPSGMTSQPQPTNAAAFTVGGDPNVTRAAMPSQMNTSRLGPQLSTPTRPTLNPDKEIMKGISFKYEEEDDDETDEELSDKELLGASGFHSSKFANIMDAGDLGINVSISSDEVDVSAELRELECSSNKSYDGLEPRTRAGIGNLDLKLPVEGKLAIPSEATSAGEQQTGIRRSQRPTTARGYRTKAKPESFKQDIDDDDHHDDHDHEDDDDDDDDTASSESLLGESRLPENVNLVDLGSDEMDANMQITTTSGLFQQPHNLDLKPAGRQANVTMGTAAVPLGNIDQARQQSQLSLDQQIAAVKLQHEEELAKLRKSFDEELEKEKDSLRAQQDIKISTYKNELSTQLAKEEKRLQTEQQVSITQLKAKLKEAQEESEAQMQEEKSNFLRTLAQQIAREKQEAEEKMRKDLELQLSRVRSQLELDRANEEKAAQKDLEDLKKTLQISRREELDSNEAEFEQQLADLNNSHQSKLDKAKQELEAEYAQMMEETKASLEKEHQKAMAAINTQYESSRKTEEERLQCQEAVSVMEKELEAELAAKKSELQQQHQQQLDGLNLELKEKLTRLQQGHQEQETKQKEEFANKLEQLKSQLEKDNNAELESLQNKVKLAKQDLQSQITQVEEELESKRTEAEQERLSIQQLLATIESEKEAAEVQRVSVEEKRKELSKEEQHIQQLRNTVAAETDQLLAERQSELKDDIEQEQRILTELKKRREQLQRDVDVLTKDKSKLEAVIEELRKQELTHRQELESTVNQIRESKAVLSQTVDELKTAQEQLNNVNKQASGHDANKEAPAAVLQELAASQESEDTLRSSSGHSSTSMSVRELASPSPTTDEVVDEAVSKPVRVAWEEKREPTADSSGLSRVQQRLISETNQLKQAQDFLQRQKHSIKKQRADLIQAQRSWMTDQGRMGKQSVSSTVPGHKTTPQTVLKNFEKEAAAISSVEDQLLLTDRLLMMKEKHLTQLEDSVTSNVDSSSMDNWDSTTPPRAYTAHSRDQFRHHRLRMDSLSPERLPKSSVTITTDSDEVVNSKQPLRRKKHKLLFTKHSSCDEEDGDTTNSVDHVVPSSEIMSSLNKINSQLGEVLTRLAHPSTTTTTASSTHPYPNTDPLLQSRRADKTEEELLNKRLYYLGNAPQQTPSSSFCVPDIRGSPYGSSLVTPVDTRNGSMVRKSTSEMYRSQTDWLKTFQQEMSTFNRPTLKVTPLMTSNKNMSHHLSAFPAQSRTPKFVLDSKNNIHFVHV